MKPAASVFYYRGKNGKSGFPMDTRKGRKRPKAASSGEKEKTPYAVWGGGGWVNQVAYGNVRERIIHP